MKRMWSVYDHGIKKIINSELAALTDRQKAVMVESSKVETVLED